MKNHTNRYDFSAVSPSGHTLYYKIIDAEGNVELVSELNGDENMYSYQTEPCGDLVIPSTVTHNGTTYQVAVIGYSAFEGCDKLTGVTIPRTVITILNGAFGFCGIESVTIPDSVVVIGYGAFSFCSSLKSVVIPDSVADIGDYAFCGCTGLVDITIPHSVTYIGYSAFSCCSGIKSISVSGNNPCYDSRDNCNAIIDKETSILIKGCDNTVIPHSVTGIADSAFCG